MYQACFLTVDGITRSQQMNVVNCIMSDEKPNDATLVVPIIITNKTHQLNTVNLLQVYKW